MENIIDKTYEMLFCLFLMQNSPLFEVDQIINEALGKKAEDYDEIMASSMGKILSELYSDNENSNKSYEIGKIIPLLSNFRLLSKAHTERLEESDYEAFVRLKEQISYEALLPAKKIVEKTYKEIMCVNSQAKDRKTCLGPFPDESFCFDDDAIVLGLVIDEAEVSSETKESIRKIAKNMQEDIFKEISTKMNAKIELFVSVE